MDEVKAADPIGWDAVEWRSEMDKRGEKAFRGNQVFEWIHRRGVFSPAAMTNLSKK